MTSRRRSTWPRCAGAAGLAELDVLWLEEPLPGHDLAGARMLREGVGIRVAGAEMVRTFAELVDMVEADALDVYQPDVVLAVGMSRARTLAELAHLRHRWFTPHTWTNGLGLLANLHVAAGVGGGPYLEFPYDPPGWTPERRGLLPGRAGRYRRGRLPERAGRTRARRADRRGGGAAMGALKPARFHRPRPHGRPDGGEPGGGRVRAGRARRGAGGGRPARGGRRELGGQPARGRRARRAVITMLPTPAVVESVLLGADGLLGGLAPGSTWLDMSTSTPEVAARVRALARPRGIAVLDAPVAGMAASSVGVPLSDLGAP